MTVYTVFGQPASPAAGAADSASYTMGMAFTLSQSAPLTGIWFYSPPGAASLPDACCIYQESGSSQVAGTVNVSPTWSGAAGSGWVKCAYNGSVVLAANTTYKTCIHLNGASATQYASTAHYWDTGPGASGVTSGIITAVNNAAVVEGQDSFVTPGAALAFPNQSFNSSNYWIDVELTVNPPSGAPTITAPPMETRRLARIRRRARFV